MIRSTMALSAAFILAANLHGTEPARQWSEDLAWPRSVVANGAPISVPGNAAPYYGDFDEDGKRDLLVGQFDLGRLRIYRNVGEDDRPEFESFEWLATDGQIAGIPSGCNVGFTPHLADFDGDGRSDLLTGSFQGELYLFRRQIDGTFAEVEVLQNKRGQLVFRRGFPSGHAIRYNSTATVVDWDGDGDSDLLLGRSGYCLVRNEGTAQQPAFGEPSPILIGEKPIAHGLIAPVVEDWDGDGIKDLIIGCKTDIVWYRNTAKDGEPVLAPPQLLLSGEQRPGGGTDPPPAEPCRYHAICVTDFNGDDRMDLLVGDDYRQRITRSKATGDEQAKQNLVLAGRRLLRSEYSALRKEPPRETPKQRIDRFRDAVSKWQEYAPLQVSGFRRHSRVWLFARLERPGP